MFIHTVYIVSVFCIYITYKFIIIQNDKRERVLTNYSLTMKGSAVQAMSSSSASSSSSLSSLAMREEISESTSNLLLSLQ